MNPRKKDFFRISEWGLTFSSSSYFQFSFSFFYCFFFSIFRLLIDRERAAVEVDGEGYEGDEIYAV